MGSFHPFTVFGLFRMIALLKGQNYHLLKQMIDFHGQQRVDSDSFHFHDFVFRLRNLFKNSCEQKNFFQGFFVE